MNPTRHRDTDRMEQGYRAMLVSGDAVNYNSVSVSDPPPTMLPMAVPAPPPLKRRREHRVGGVNVTKQAWWLRWRFLWVTLAVFLIEAVLGGWPVAALSVWGWTALFAIGHFLWWIKAALLFPAVLRNMAAPYLLASDGVTYQGELSAPSMSLCRSFWNSAYTWDLTLWSMVSVLGHTTVSAILLILTLVTRPIFSTTTEWILLIVFDGVAIIESIVSPMIVMDWAIERPTQSAREHVLATGDTGEGEVPKQHQGILGRSGAHFLSRYASIFHPNNGYPAGRHRTFLAPSPGGLAPGLLSSASSTSSSSPSASSAPLPLSPPMRSIGSIVATGGEDNGGGIDDGYDGGGDDDRHRRRRGQEHKRKQRRRKRKHKARSKRKLRNPPLQHH